MKIENLESLLAKKEEIITKIFDILVKQNNLIKDRVMTEVFVLNEQKLTLLKELADVEPVSVSSQKTAQNAKEKANNINQMLEKLIIIEKDNENMISKFMENYTAGFLSAYQKMKPQL